MDRAKNINICQEWGDAFLDQARTDQDVYHFLVKNGLPVCHQLHYLQMFMEKLAKSLLWKGHDPQGGEPWFAHSHNVIAPVLPNIVKHHLRKTEGVKLSPGDFEEIQQICRELDLLAPAIDQAGSRKDNCEYPWRRLDENNNPIVQIHRKWDFPIRNRIHNHLGKRILRAAAGAISNQ